MKTAESAVLRACLDYLRTRGHFVIRINCGGGVDRNGRPIRGTDINGVADIIGLEKGTGRGLAVECKSDKGRQTERQKIFENSWTWAGGLYVVARGIDDLKAAGL